MIGTNEIVLDDRTTFITYKDKHWVFTGYDFVQLSSPCCEEKSGPEVTRIDEMQDKLACTIPQQFATHPNALKPGQSVSPKRNKQVDVPTEAWQKSVERRLDGYEDLLKDLGTFIYENNLTADEAREFLNNRFMR